MADGKLSIKSIKLGLCDVDKKNDHDFLNFFSISILNHDFDTNRHALQL